MTKYINTIIAVVKYFFTPEDSDRPSLGSLTFSVDHQAIGIGSAKALFWVVNATLIVTLLSLM